MQQKNDDEEEKDEMKRAKEVTGAYVRTTPISHGGNVPSEGSEFLPYADDVEAGLAALSGKTLTHTHKFDYDYSLGV